MRNLYFGVLLAPYRLDYYNYMATHMNCDIYFQYKEADDVLFSIKDLEKKCVFTPRYLESANVFKGRLVAKNLRKIINEAQPNYIIVPEFSLLTIQVILLKKLYGYRYRVISQCDDSYAMLEGEGFSKVHAWSRNFCLKYLDDLILLDIESTKWYQQYFRKGVFMPLILDENRIEHELLVKARTKAVELKQKYQLDEKKTILYVGRLVEVKNLFRLIDACGRLDFSYQLIIVGDGILRKDLEEYAVAKHVNVLFVGPQSGVDLYAWYCASNVFILPSTMEAFGSVTNEALLCGCISCISRLAGSSCLIEEGKNGYLLDPLSVDDIVKQIERSIHLADAHVEKLNKMPMSFAKYMENLKNTLETSK